MIWAAAVPLILGILQAGRRCSRWPVLAGFGVAPQQRDPVLLETEALRRMPANVFGVLMSLELALAAPAGFLILSQSLGARELWRSRSSSRRASRRAAAPRSPPPPRPRRLSCCAAAPGRHTGRGVRFQPVNFLTVLRILLVPCFVVALLGAGRGERRWPPRSSGSFSDGRDRRLIDISRADHDVRQAHGSGRGQAARDRRALSLVLARPARGAGRDGDHRARVRCHRRAAPGARGVVIAANWGKAKTPVQMLTIFLFHPSSTLRRPGSTSCSRDGGRHRDQRDRLLSSMRVAAGEAEAPRRAPRRGPAA